MKKQPILENEDSVIPHKSQGFTFLQTDLCDASAIVFLTSIFVHFRMILGKYMCLSIFMCLSLLCVCLYLCVCQYL